MQKFLRINGLTSLLTPANCRAAIIRYGVRYGVVAGVLSGAALMLGCSDSDEAKSDDDEQQINSSQQAVTYYEDVAPIVERNCSGCHTEGGVGPFVLETFEDMAPRAELIEHVTRERIMPPFLADNSGECQTYKDASWLSDDELKTISDWVAGGKREGDKKAMPDFDKAVDRLDATHTLKLSEPYLPNAPANGDDYRCFLVDPEIETDKFVTAYEVVPGDAHIVHHVIVYNPDNADEVAAARDLDEAEDGPGFTCFGGPIVKANVAAAWAPGRTTWTYPKGTGIRLKPGIPQIIQVHYNLHESAKPDQTEVKFKLVDKVEKELFAWFFANTQLVLPPGKESTGATFEITPELYLRDGLERPEMVRPMTLVGIAPHMHKLGQSERVELTQADGSGTECLVQVPRWDFNWQFMYLFENPIKLKPNDVLRMNCDFDTRSRKEKIYWGEGTSDEMCLSLMFSTFD